MSKHPLTIAAEYLNAARPYFFTWASTGQTITIIGRAKAAEYLGVSEKTLPAYISQRGKIGMWRTNPSTSAPDKLMFSAGHAPEFGQPVPKGDSPAPLPKQARGRPAVSNLQAQQESWGAAEPIDWAAVRDRHKPKK